LEALREPDALQDVLAGSKIAAEFNGDKTVGTAGCNNYFATFSVEENKLHTGAIASTRKMCHSPDGIMEQEADFFITLESSDSFKLEDDKLMIYDATGKLVLVFR